MNHFLILAKNYLHWSVHTYSDLLNYSNSLSLVIMDMYE